MVTRSDWLPTRLSDLFTMFNNILGKIGNYELVLPLTAAQVTEIETIATNFIATFNFVDTSRSTMQSLTEWRDMLLEGEPVGDPLPAAPVFNNIGAVTGSRGILPRFRELRELIVAQPGYTLAIGEDLMIVGAETTSTPEAEVAPSLKLTTATGYKVNVAGSMQGMDAMRVEYKRSGGSWITAAFLTKTPGEFTVTPQTPGDPESGHVRAVFTKKNEQFGNFSPEYPITVS